VVHPQIGLPGTDDAGGRGGPGGFGNLRFPTNSGFAAIDAEENAPTDKINLALIENNILFILRK